MKIPLVFHFWNDESVSQWSPKRFPLPEIEKAVKDDYAVLQYEKPPERQYGPYRAILEYNTSRDAFNREIVAIRFAFIKTSSLEPEIEAAIRSALSKASRDEAFLRVHPWLIKIASQVSRSGLDGKTFLKYGAIVLSALIVAGFFYNRLIASRSPEIRATAPARLAYPVPSVREEDKLLDVCSSAKEDNILLSCPRSYIALVCSGKKAPLYRDWRQKSDACRQARRNKFAVGEDVFLERPREPLASEILKTLFP